MKLKFEIRLSEEQYITFDLAQTSLNGFEQFCLNPTICEDDYIENKEDYTYFEANFDGTTLADGYKKLMGLEDVVGKEVDYNDSGEPNITLQNIQLKHEPSWQLHSIKSYSARL